MGLMVDSTYGVPVVHHGGDLIGYHSDMMWLPEHGVGAVMLTNGDPGWVLRGSVRAQAPRSAVRRPPERLMRTSRRRPRASTSSSPPSASCSPCPPSRPTQQARAARYANDALGEITVTRAGTESTFDFGEWKSEVRHARNPDGSQYRSSRSRRGSSGSSSWSGAWTETDVNRARQSAHKSTSTARRAAVPRPCDEPAGSRRVTCDNACARTVNGVLSVGNFNLTSVTARTFLAALLKPCCLPPVREPIAGRGLLDAVHRAPRRCGHRAVCRQPRRFLRQRARRIGDRALQDGGDSTDRDRGGTRGRRVRHARRGSIGSTRGGCSSRSATCRRRSTRRATMSRPRWPDSHELPSEIPGTIHFFTSAADFPPNEATSRPGMG